MVAPDRLRGVGCVILDDIDVAIAETTRCKRLGLATVNVPSKPLGPHYGSDAYDRFWAAAQDLEMPVSTHIGSNRGVHAHSRQKERMRRMVAGPTRDFSSGAIALPNWDVQEMIFQLIVSGVFGIFFSAAIACSEGESANAVVPTNASAKNPKSNDRAKLLIFPSIWRYVYVFL